MFNSFSDEFPPSSRLINIFPNWLLFYLSNQVSKNSRVVHIYKLNEYILYALTNLKTVVVVSNMSIKNQIATSIVYVHSFRNPIIKTLHHVVNVTTTETELFAIKCSINQAVQIININYIVIVTYSIHTAHKIISSSVHPYQIQSSAISRKLREFFNKDLINSIKFWDCFSNDNWTLHSIVDKEIKEFNLISLLPYKSSWNFNRKKECDDILNMWKMTFQASDKKGRYSRSSWQWQLSY